MRCKGRRIVVDFIKQDAIRPFRIDANIEAMAFGFECKGVISLLTNALHKVIHGIALDLKNNRDNEHCIIPYGSIYSPLGAGW